MEQSLLCTFLMYCSLVGDSCFAGEGTHGSPLDKEHNTYPYILHGLGGRVNDGRTENITIEHSSTTAGEGWVQFLDELRLVEDEWKRGGLIVGVI